MTEDHWLYLLMVVVAAICIYELFTGNLTRWSERGAVKTLPGTAIWFVLTP